MDATYTDPAGGLISPAAELLLHFPVIDKVEPKILQGKVASLNVWLVPSGTNYVL